MLYLESLVPDGTVPASGSILEDDLGKLQTLLEDDTPAYILARLGGAGSSWLAIFYVPDTAKVRDKVRGALLLDYLAEISRAN